MDKSINELIELEKSKLPNRIDKCTVEARQINMDMTINDHTDVDEIALMIKFSARLRKIKELNKKSNSNEF